MKSLKLSERMTAAEPQEPCDPARLKVLEEAMREAIDAYLLYIDPHTRVSRAEFVDHVVGILDRREVADAAGHVDPGPPVENELARTQRRSAN
jgi:hypothetical protein